MQKQKPNYRPLFFTLILSLLAAGAVIYFTLGDSQRTVPKIKPSYFSSSEEIVQAVLQRLHLEIGQKKYFWIGYEPEKIHQLNLSAQLMKGLEKVHGPFDQIILDQELGLTSEQIKLFGSPLIVPIKVDFENLAETLKASAAHKKTLVITAAIYSTSLIQQNPATKIFELIQVRPMTFSIGHFSVTSEDEKNNLFKCDTEDRTGTSPWGCAVLNKARSVRRRINMEKLKASPAPIMGLMDLTGESDYMILMGKPN